MEAVVCVCGLEGVDNFSRFELGWPFLLGVVLFKGWLGGRV